MERDKRITQTPPGIPPDGYFFIPCIGFCIGFGLCSTPADKRKALIFLVKSRLFLGAGEQIRTAYLFITNEVLYLLSYTSVPSSDFDIINYWHEKSKPFL